MYVYTYVYDEPHEIAAVGEAALKEPGGYHMVRERHHVVVVARRVRVRQQDREHRHVLVFHE